MSVSKSRQQACSQPNCPKKVRAAGLCNAHRWEILGVGERTHTRPAKKREFTHGRTTGVAKGCTCTDCKRARRKSYNDSYRRRREAVLNGTYDGPHGDRCARLGCQCPLAAVAREEDNRRERERRAAQGGRKRRKGGQWADRFRVEGRSVTVLHYPPRGHGLWECPTCGQSFPHRPLVDQQQAA